MLVASHFCSPKVWRRTTRESALGSAAAPCPTRVGSGLHPPEGGSSPRLLLSPSLLTCCALLISLEPLPWPRTTLSCSRSALRTPSSRSCVFRTLLSPLDCRARPSRRADPTRAPRRTSPRRKTRSTRPSVRRRRAPPVQRSHAGSSPRSGPPPRRQAPLCPPPGPPAPFFFLPPFPSATKLTTTHARRRKSTPSPKCSSRCSRAGATSSALEPTSSRRGRLSAARTHGCACPHEVAAFARLADRHPPAGHLPRAPERLQPRPDPLCVPGPPASPCPAEGKGALSRREGRTAFYRHSKILVAGLNGPAIGLSAGTVLLFLFAPSAGTDAPAGAALLGVRFATPRPPCAFAAL